MATRGNEATGKDATATPSPESKRLRSATDLLDANERNYNDLAAGSITAKQAEQRSQCIRLPLRIAGMQMQFVKMVHLLSKDGKAPPTANTVLEELVGLPATLDSLPAGASTEE